MSRLAWTDPAPLAVERPRLPWWTKLFRKLLAAASPIILSATVAAVAVFVARRLWRYPLCVTSTVGAFHTTDADLDDLCPYVLTGWLDISHPAAGRQALA
jgi:hypothetical protein